MASILKICNHLLIMISYLSFALVLSGFFSHTTDAAAHSLYPDGYGTATLNRSSFPDGFIFGTSSSAYQYEGAVNLDGREPSIWDNFTHQYPEKIADGSNGDVTILQYEKYKEDISIMKDMGLDAYRLSLSWSRIIPMGKLSSGVNEKGIEYYNDLINELLDNDIEPFVALNHWDTPQALEDEYGGFLSDRIVDDFRDYADLCFSLFGDRVKRWVTINEAWTYTNGGYATGILAPGRCSAWLGNNCTGGDSGTEPYLVAHHQLLAHATAVKVYRDKYKAFQMGEIGMIIATHWYEPYSNSSQDINARNRALDFMVGWFMEPVTTGDYPHSMRVLVGDRLPKFTEEQARTINGSLDFLGLNYYTSNYASYAPPSNGTPPSYTTDGLFDLTTERNGKPIGPRAASSWLYIYPRGFREILLYVKHRYSVDLPIYVLENGCDEFNNPTLPLQKQLNDTFCRIDYHYHHLVNLLEAVMEGANVKGYFAWSLVDSFEWNSGFTVRFGINYVDYRNNNLTRIPKLSYFWFKNLLQRPSSIMEYLSRSDQ